MKKKRKAVSRRPKGIIESAVSAAQELGEAALAAKASWDHVQNARRRGDRALKPVQRAGRTAAKAIKKAVRKTKQAVKKKR